MLRYVLRRLLLMIPTLLGLSILTFLISHVVPADPAALAAGPQAPAEAVAKIREQFGLDRPLYEQYFSYLTNLLHGDWGTSIMSRRDVLSDIGTYFPATLELVLASMVIAVAIGIPFGVLAAVYQNRWPDHTSRVLSISFASLPRFWFGIIVQLTIGLGLGLLPISGRLPPLQAPPNHITGIYTLDSLLTLDFGVFALSAKYLILPAFVQSVGSLAVITRIVRGEMIEVLQRDYVRTARSKGLRERQVMFGHALRNAMIPTLTMIGLSLGYSLGGSVLVETIFDWPGIGSYAVNSVASSDFQPIMGVTLLVGTIFVLINLVVDLLYGILDPRIQYS